MTSVSSSPAVASSPGAVLAVAPNRVIRGTRLLAKVGPLLAELGQRPLLIGGDHSLAQVRPRLAPVWVDTQLIATEASYLPDCCESSLEILRQAVQTHRADLVIGVGGGKALDAAKLVAYQCQLPIVTIPTTAATCAAWTALSNVYSEDGAFLHDVGLPQGPQLLLLDYDVMATAPPHTLVAGIGDALAKWYEASVSSGQSQDTLIIAAVQQARVLRDILLQKAADAIANPGTPVWQEVVDACILMAGMIGGLGGAQCRTVAAHAVHNGLTHLPASHSSLHGTKVAYGILVQLRLEEMLGGNQLAATARQQLLSFYQTIGLPTTLSDLGMADISLPQLNQAATLACAPSSDLHHLPFSVTPEHLIAAMVSTTVPAASAARLAQPHQLSGE